MSSATGMSSIGLGVSIAWWIKQLRNSTRSYEISWNARGDD